uniref:Uncharacterized protein n=1 Tax=Oryza barthii TaxID=65489 RepID=A0A0D3GZ80_9ORYZ
MTSDGGGGGAVEGREQATIEEEPVLLPPVYEAPHVEAVHGCGAHRRDLDHDAEMARQGGSGMEVGGEYAQSQKGAFDRFVVRETQDATVADGHGGDVEEVEVNVAQGDAVEANIDEGDVDNIADEGHAANIAEEGHETHDGNIADEASVPVAPRLTDGQICRSPFPRVVSGGFAGRCLAAGVMDAELRLRRLPLPTGSTPQRCHLIVYRSCPDVKGTQLCSLLNELYHKPVVPAGILLPPDTGDGHDRSDMMRWLDKQLARSVVYVALGTEAPITSGNVRELDSSRRYATPASGCRRGTSRGVVEMR